MKKFILGAALAAFSMGAIGTASAATSVLNQVSPQQQELIERLCMEGHERLCNGVHGVTAYSVIDGNFVELGQVKDFAGKSNAEVKKMVEKVIVEKVITKEIEVIKTEIEERIVTVTELVEDLEEINRLNNIIATLEAAGITDGETIEQLRDDVTALEGNISQLQADIAAITPEDGVTQADVDAAAAQAFADGAASVTPEDGITQADVDAAVAAVETEHTVELRMSFNPFTGGNTLYQPETITVDGTENFIRTNAQDVYNRGGIDVIDNIISDVGLVLSGNPNGFQRLQAIKDHIGDLEADLASIDTLVAAATDGTLNVVNGTNYDVDNGNVSGPAGPNVLLEDSTVTLFDADGEELLSHTFFNINAVNIVEATARDFYNMGYTHGYDEGYDAGYTDGFRDGVASVTQ